MSKVYYITYNDTYSGIYQSQVIDVINHLNSTFNVTIQLIAFVPLRLFKHQKQQIKSKLPEANVLPILGKTTFIQTTALWFRFKNIGSKSISITRGPLAYFLAKKRFKSVIYDARAAVKAEVNEYNVTNGDIRLSNLMINAEKEAVSNADFYIAVSMKLLDYWKTEYNKDVQLSDIALVPCTVNSFVKQDFKNTSETIKLVYAGGTGSWQSFETIVYLLDKLLEKQSTTEIIFLTKENDSINHLIDKFPNRVQRLWVKPEEVNEILSNCDYGLLIRDDKVTNNVASPVKFAEYLNAGLSVLISPKIGDFSDFVLSNDCGYLIKDEIPTLEKVNTEKKHHNKNLSDAYFSKNSKRINDQYRKLIQFIEQV